MLGSFSSLGSRNPAAVFETPRIKTIICLGRAFQTIPDGEHVNVVLEKHHNMLTFVSVEDRNKYVEIGEFTLADIEVIRDWMSEYFQLKGWKLKHKTIV